MDNVQIVLFKLLREIHEICDKHSLTYYLGRETAFCALRWGRFPDNCRSATVFLDADDYDKFEHLAVKDRDDRRIESLMTNPHFPLICLKYSDVSSTYINLLSLDQECCFGIGVYVCKLLPYDKKKPHRFKLKAAFGALQYENVYSEGTIRGKSRAIVQLLSLFGTPMKRALYCMDLLKKNENFKHIYVQRYYKKPLVFPAEVFSKRIKVTLESFDFFIPAETHAYLSIQYGRRWEQREIVFKPIGLGLIVDAQVPYSEYQENLTQIESEAKKLSAARRKRIGISNRRAKLKVQIEKNQYFFDRTVDRINCTDRYLRNKDRAVSLYKAGKFFELALELSDYQDICEKYLRRGIPFAFDRDFFFMMCDVLNWQNLLKVRRKLLASKDASFVYLDEVCPDNKQELSGSLYRYLAKQRWFEVIEHPFWIILGATESEKQRLLAAKRASEEDIFPEGDEVTLTPSDESSDTKIAVE